MHDLHRTVERVIRQAGDIMLRYADPQVYAKGRHADYVTEADYAVQAYLMEALSAAFPDAAFFAEEKKENQLGEGLTFIIDPIDGTMNYLRRRSQSVISVGVVEHGKPVYGAILHPYRSELFHASLGHGAWCGDERLHVSDVPLERALIGLGTSPYNEELRPVTARCLMNVMEHCADVRRSGSACVDLCEIAAGLSEGMFEWRLSPWDYCAGSLIVQEAGGRCGQIEGGAEIYDRPCAFMAASESCFDALQALLQRAKEEA